MADERASAYWELDGDEERAVFRASGLGAACEQSLVRALVGLPAAPPPEFMLRKFDEGRVAEPLILGVLRDRFGWKQLSGERLGYFGPVGDDGQVQVELKVGRHVVRCHPDGIAVQVEGADTLPGLEVGKMAVVEVKALGEGLYRRWEREGLGVIDAYAMQASIEMLATKLPLVYAVGMKDGDGVVDLDSVQIKTYTEPPIKKSEIVKRVVRVVKAAEQVMAGEGGFGECEARQFPCGFYELDGTACGGGGEVETITDGEVVRLAGKAMSLSLSIKAQQKELDACKAELLELLDLSESTVRDAGNVRIKYTAEGPGAVSWKSVAAELADDELDEIAERHRGKPRKPSLSLEEL